MKIERYEVARNAYTKTQGRWHVRGLTADNMTQFETDCPMFVLRSDAEQACRDMNADLNAGREAAAAWREEMNAHAAAHPELF